MRYELETLGFSSDVELRYALTNLVREIGLPLHIDKELLFWEQHFDGKDWAVYKNGRQKGGTLRFKDGVLRIPTSSQLTVYETQDYKREDRFPRASVAIDNVTICCAKELSRDELDRDGFTDHNEMLHDMKSYYPTITPESYVSFYRFGQTEWFDKDLFEFSKEQQCWLPKR